MRQWHFTALRDVPVSIAEIQGGLFQVSVMYPNDPKTWQASSYEIINAGSFATIMTTPYPNTRAKVEILLADSELARLFPINDRAVAMDIS